MSDNLFRFLGVLSRSFPPSPFSLSPALSFSNSSPFRSLSLMLKMRLQYLNDYDNQFGHRRPRLRLIFLSRTKKHEARLKVQAVFVQAPPPQPLPPPKKCSFSELFLVSNSEAVEIFSSFLSLWALREEDCSLALINS